MSNEKRQRCSRLRVALAVAMAVGVVPGLSACGHGPRGPERKLDEASYPWVLRPATAWPRDVLLKQRVEARAGPMEHGFDAALQKRDDTLTLLGLTPFGTRAFLVEQRGVEVAFRSYIDRELPFPPRFMLIDIQRAFYPTGETAEGRGDGLHELVIEGERIAETWTNGVLVRRTFERIDGTPPGQITVDYQDWRDGIPFQIRIDNPWFGYTMKVTTQEATLLSSP